MNLGKAQTSILLHPLKSGGENDNTILIFRGSQVTALNMAGNVQNMRVRI